MCFPGYVAGKRKTMQGNDDKDNSFIRETIKNKPVNRKRMISHVLFVVFSAAVFGVVASLVIAFAEPKFKAAFYPEEEPVVTIPKDEETGTESDDTEVTEATEEEEAVQPEDQEMSTGNVPVETVVKELGLADYQQLQNMLYDVGRAANKSIVTVTGVKSDTDWFDNPYESKGQASGIIVADNGQEILILTERKVISDAEEIYVTFEDEFQAQASMKKYDGNTGIAILSVARSDIDEQTLSNIAIATLGNSYLTRQGAIVIAVGSPLGTNYSILTGCITSTTNSISTADCNYTVFTTDIVGSANGSGALLDVDGAIVGLVMQDYSSTGDQGTLTAVSISELKTLIEMLSNNQDIPYIGLELSTVTNDIANEYDIPKGAYIKNVIMDSPAMSAGLQNGDVITELNGENIFSADSYESKLMALTPGDTARIKVERQGTDGYSEVTYRVTIGILE
jgi:serine protease Do